MATPAASAVIRRRKLAGGLIMSASHNPGAPAAEQTSRPAQAVMAGNNWSVTGACTLQAGLRRTGASR
jgi:Phosphoglucomutase/phosphomannomutase, alpha/beta/alpha domain I